MSSPQPKYEIHRITQPEDLATVIEIEDQAFFTNPIDQAVRECITTDENRALQKNLKRTRLLNAFEGRTDTSLDFQWGKAVYYPTPSEKTTTTADDDNKEAIAAIIGFHAPAPTIDKGTTTTSRPTEPHPPPPPAPSEDLPTEIQKARQIMERLFAGLMGQKSDELMGSDHKAHYWFLSSLATLPEHQQRGLATRLVQWSIDLARADAKARRPGEIKGVWTIATPSGLKTYLRAGMKEIGSEVIYFGKGGGENGQKYVWLVMRFDE